MREEAPWCFRDGTEWAFFGPGHGAYHTETSAPSVLWQASTPRSAAVHLQSPLVMTSGLWTRAFTTTTNWRQADHKKQNVSALR